MSADQRFIQTDRSGIENLPDQAGAYSFYDADKALLYVGKSVNLKRRVSEHLRHQPQSRKGEKLQEEVDTITVFPTAGDLGASMLELHFIKQRQPILNKQSRKKKRVVTATADSADGFLYPKLSRTKEVDPENVTSLLGVFKSRKQAKEIISDLAREYELCQQRLQIATANQAGPCFYYQLNQCRGACVGEEDAGDHNRRFRRAFADYSVDTWPHDGSIEICESESGRTDRFVIDDWRLISAKTIRGDKETDFFPDAFKIKGFNYDVYKCLAKYIMRSDVLLERE